MNRNSTKLRHDLLMLLLDIVAVNLAYYIALIIRVSISDVGGVFESAQDVPAYFSALYRFAPVYTVLCIVVFYLFRLYSGVWRYAGANDLQRILGATVVTSVIHVIGTILISRRMPVTYYVIGGVLQFLFVATIRFARKIVSAEIKKRSGKNGMALVVGAGELGQQTIQILQSGDEFRVSCIVDTENEYVGKMLNGIPVYSLDQLVYTLEHNDIKCVFLAEPQLKKRDRAVITNTCRDKGIDLKESLISPDNSVHPLNWIKG